MRSGCYNRAVAQRSPAFDCPGAEFSAKCRSDSPVSRLGGKSCCQRGQVAQVVERSPEKAGVGGSTPSLATIIPEDLAAQSRIFQPTIQPMLDDWVGQVQGRSCPGSHQRCHQLEHLRCPAMPDSRVGCHFPRRQGSGPGECGKDVVLHFG
jgi:hypothetical protein